MIFMEPLALQGRGSGSRAVWGTRRRTWSWRCSGSGFRGPRRRCVCTRSGCGARPRTSAFCTPRNPGPASRSTVRPPAPGTESRVRSAFGPCFSHCRLSGRAAVMKSSVTPCAGRPTCAVNLAATRRVDAHAAVRHVKGRRPGDACETMIGRPARGWVRVSYTCGDVPLNGSRHRRFAVGCQHRGKVPLTTPHHPESPRDRWPAEAPRLDGRCPSFASGS
jgi:hypothetical protein